VANRNISPIQFSPESAEKGKKNLHKDRSTHPSMSNTQCVYGQLTDDYPKEALSWVEKTKWSGPKKVPVDKIDWDDEHVWKAAHEPSHVNLFVRKIKEEEKKGDHVKPVILVNRPGKTPPLMIPDGHHRALAYRKLGQPVWAWEGKVTRAKGPWDTLHDSQYKDDGKKDIYR
jgi:hypothetical protein